MAAATALPGNQLPKIGSAGPDVHRLPTFPSKRRVFILTDMLNEPDDSQSFVRYLLYSNELDTRGVVACTSAWLRDETHPEEIIKITQAYGSIRDNLNKHVHPDFQYPTVDQMLSLVASGPKVFGKAAFEEPLSDGSRMLIERLEESPEPLYVAVWGGVNTLAQALKHMTEHKSPEECTELQSRLRVYAISDQDDTAPWIRIHYPLIHYVVSIHAPHMYELAAWRGISAEFPGANNEIIGKDWLKENIQAIGPLGESYPTTTWVMEGDTPSFLWLVPNGLNDSDHIEWGGWGGRYGRVSTAGFDGLYCDCIDRVLGPDGQAHISNHASIWRWRDAYQNDFAGRLAWTMAEEFSAARHPPVVSVNGNPGAAAVRLPVKAGEVLTFDARETWDPDHPGTTRFLDFQWFHYWEPSIPHPIPTNWPEAGGLLLASDSDSGDGGDQEGGILERNEAGFRNVVLGERVKVTIPEERRWGDLHLVLQVRTIGGKYPLTRYRRFIIEKPAT